MTSRSELKPIKSMILRTLSARRVRGANLTELIEATGGKRWSVAPTITRLHKDGLIVREGSWRSFRYWIAGQPTSAAIKGGKPRVARKAKRQRSVAAA
jgi:hypothetical protein